MSKPVIIGRFGKTHGLKGWLRVQSFTEPKANITDYFPWQIAKQNVWQSVNIDEHRWQGDNLLVHIEGIDTPELAQTQYTGKQIAVSREKLPSLKENEFYWADLEGLKVITEEGQELGFVDYLFTSGANDVLVVKGDKERFIPYLRDDVIKQVDLAKGHIRVDWDPDF